MVILVVRNHWLLSGSRVLAVIYEEQSCQALRKGIISITVKYFLVLISELSMYWPQIFLSTSLFNSNGS